MSFSKKRYNAGDVLRKFIKMLKGATHEKFLEKVYDKDPKFVIQSNDEKTNITNENQNNMKKLPFNELKALVYASAIQLLQIGTTTNLEIKNHCRAANPGIDVRQDDVHTAMEELSNEKSDWTRDNTTTTGGWYEYTLSANYVQPTTAPVTSQPATTNPANLTAVAYTGNGNAVIGKVGDNSTAFLNGLDGNVRVCFATGFDAILTNTTDKLEARKLYNRSVPGVKWDDIRIITLATYLQRHDLKA